MVARTLLAQVLLQRMPLVPMMHPLRALLQADRNQQPQRNRPQVNPEILPRMHSTVRRMNIDHSRLLVVVRARANLLSLHTLRAVGRTLAARGTTLGTNRNGLVL
jgi:hypothetical protein